MRKITWLAGAILLLSVSAAAQETPQAEVSAGYSFFRISESGSSSNFNGGSGSIAFNVNHWLGVVGDVGAYHNSDFGVSSNVYTYQFGPRISFRGSGRVTPFAQVLVGGAHLTASAGGSSGSINSFAMSAGGGVDFRANEYMAIRAIQAEYVFTHFAGVRQNNARISAGVVFRFGRK